MAYTKSGWYVGALSAIFQGTTQTGGNLLLTGQQASEYISLLSSSVTDYSSPVNFASSGGQAWVNTDEITGTNWATGGVQLSTNGVSADTLTISGGSSSAAILTYSWTGGISVASTTLTGIYGCIVYNHAISSPVAKPCIISLCFGSAYNTVNGTFGITPSGSGLSQLTLTQ